MDILTRLQIAFEKARRDFFASEPLSTEQTKTITRMKLARRLYYHRTGRTIDADLHPPDAAYKSTLRYQIQKNYKL